MMQGDVTLNFSEKHSKLFTQATPPLNDSADFHTHYLVPYYWTPLLDSLLDKFLKVNVYANRLLLDKIFKG